MACAPRLQGLTAHRHSSAGPVKGASAKVPKHAASTMEISALCLAGAQTMMIFRSFARIDLAHLFACGRAERVI